MNAFKLRQSLLLILTAVIWGVAFVAQSDGMKYVGPFTFVCVRSFIGGLVLIPVVLWRRRRAGGHLPGSKKALLLGGALCGLALMTASVTQQFGIISTAVGKAGFITAFYIVLVPILGIFLRRKCPWPVWIAVTLALAGLYFLCMTGSFSVQSADLLLFLCAFLFSAHILIIDRFSDKVDGVAMACLQFFTCGLLCLPFTLGMEKPALSDLTAAWLPILYAGCLSSGVAYTLQIVAQRGMNPTVASLLMSLESVVSVLAGFVLLHQQLTPRELLGCGLMFAAVILAQLEPPGRKHPPTEEKPTEP